MSLEQVTSQEISIQVFWELISSTMIYQGNLTISVQILWYGSSNLVRSWSKSCDISVQISRHLPTLLMRFLHKAHDISVQISRDVSKILWDLSPSLKISQSKSCEISFQISWDLYKSHEILVQIPGDLSQILWDLSPNLVRDPLQILSGKSIDLLDLI